MELLWVRPSSFFSRKEGGEGFPEVFELSYGEEEGKEVVKISLKSCLLLLAGKIGSIGQKQGRREGSLLVSHLCGIVTFLLAS